MLHNLGIKGFTYNDLHLPLRLRDLDEKFRTTLRQTNPKLSVRFEAYRDGAAHSALEESTLLIEVSVYVSGFVATLFGCEEESKKLMEEAKDDSIVFAFKKEFMQRRVFKKFTPRDIVPGSFDELDAKVKIFSSRVASHHFQHTDPERGTARMIMEWVQGEKDPAEAKKLVGHAKQKITSAEEARTLLAEFLPLAGEQFIKELLSLFERWAYARQFNEEGKKEIAGWTSYNVPLVLDFSHLVATRAALQSLPEAMMISDDEHLRDRDGFDLTDKRMALREIESEVDYCVLCHVRGRDSCSHGFVEKDGSIKKNPLGIELPGCPLEEKISEAHTVKAQGDSIAALAIIMIDNPMCPGTGHRICNDCMKACIYQKQEPVNIPQIETAALTDVLNFSYGFEIYGLFTRWNPLNRKRPFMLPYNGKNILIVGLGPAGYTLAHYLTLEGFGVVGIDGLKIEPFARELTGDDKHSPRPIKSTKEIFSPLDERILSGFGGVSEYGITVRWDKNFLTTIHLTLARRTTFRIYGGVRFGGTLSIEEAWALGFDHIAIAAGAGKPTIIPMKNNLIRGIRKASDFLMALQLTGAFKKDSFANLQVQLPAVVIGGGLTAIDTATELAAYYPLQVEKILDRFEILSKESGEETLWKMYDEEEKIIMKRFLEHGRAVRAEREEAEKEYRAPKFIPLVREWGGVSIVYRKSLLDSPAYRLNHEEVIKSLEEGITYVEKMSPVEAIADEYGAVKELRFERQSEDGSRWRGTGEFVTLPARSVCVAAGTSPNVIYEREHPGTFELDQWKEFFLSYVKEGSEEKIL